MNAFSEFDESGSDHDEDENSEDFGDLIIMTTDRNFKLPPSFPQLMRH